MAGLVGQARAQSVRDAVREHVAEGLEGNAKDERRRGSPRAGREGASSKGTAKKRATRKRQRPADSGAPAEEQARSEPRGRRAAEVRAGPEAPSGLAEPGGPRGVAATNPEPPLPWRVFGKSLELDVKLGGGIRGWYPEQYPLVRVDHASYLTWSIDVKAKLFGFLRLHRGYYESNGLRGPRTRGAVIARDVGRLVPKAAWLLGTLGIPLSRRWETLVSYETRSFATHARPAAPVAIAGRKTSPETDLSRLPRSDRPLEFISGFETLVLGVRYFPERGHAGLVGDSGGRIPPMYLGVGFTQYSKPYQVQVGGDPLDEILFDGRFRGAGLAYGLATARGVGRPYVTLDTQLGLGEVSLLEDLTLNELLPEDWLIGYLQGNVTLGYILPLLRARPTPLVTAELTAGGATFFYFEIQDDGESAPTLPLNWDLFWAAHVSLTLPL